MMERFGRDDDEDGSALKEMAEQLLPIANVGRIMKQVLPPNAKVSKEAKEMMQECVSEFICFVTSEASDKCKREKRKTMSGDDVCLAMSALGFDYYASTVRRYLQRYRELEDGRVSQERNNADDNERDGTDRDRNRAESSTTVTNDLRTNNLF